MPTLIEKYRVWCETEAAYVDTDWVASRPTECPNNPGHTITADKTALLLSELRLEPMGFENRDDTDISFTNGTRTFSIAPASGVSSFRVFVKGMSFAFTSAQEVVIPDTDGLYFIYFDADGVLTQSATPWDLEETAQVAIVSWDATADEAIIFCDERHGLVMDWRTHKYLHLTRGAALDAGTPFEVGDYTVSGDGSADSHAQLSLQNGNFEDEDLQFSVINDATPTEDWEQKLSPIAWLPVYYKTGSEGSPVWRKQAATAFPLKQGTSRPQYNQLSGGSFSAVDVPNNQYFAVWVCVTSQMTEPVFLVMGEQAEDSLTSASLLNDYEALNKTNFPFQEIIVLYRLIFRASDSFTNTPHAALRGVQWIQKPGKTHESVEATVLPILSIYANHSYFNTSTKEDKIEFTSTEWEVIASFFYDGSDIVTPHEFRVVGSRSGASGVCEVRLWDFDNLAQIAIISFSAEDKDGYSTDLLSNLPSGSAIFEVQARTTGSKSGVHSFKLF